ncbi:hypothetical protein O181_047749 [Austropuccinia psidii MF-1]|uniref:Integrase catalytic domain-containing protein n=1 Tax=Austropuccinia psidii MF-1 TaxID=1389203 RepID=A0A9Q3DRM4_9BASI|nr:hypothetical protein [Austropuccinia psidii MF-1]
MDWVTALPPSGDRSYNACLVNVDRYRKILIFLPCHKDDTAMDKALLIWNRVISHTGLVKNIISDQEPKFTTTLCTNIHRFFGPSYHSLKHTTLKLMGQTAAILEKGFNPRLPENTLRKDLVELHPTAFRFKMMHVKVKDHAKQSMNSTFDYAKKKWDKSHKVPDFKVGNLALVSTFNFDNVKGQKKLKNSHLGAFVIVSLHGTNAVQVELSGELENKHPTFPFILIKTYQPADKELFLLRNPAPLTVPPVEQSKDKKIQKFIQKRRLRCKNQREYLVRYINSVHEDAWLAESEIHE